MDSTSWSRGEESFQASSEIPPLPTREQELQYLDELERELRERPFLERNLVPDPSRHSKARLKSENIKYKTDYWHKFALGGILLSPLAMGLTKLSPAKTSPIGIPYRAYGSQYKIRFWSFFILYDAFLAYTFASIFRDNRKLKSHLYPLYQTRERKL